MRICLAFAGGESITGRFFEKRRILAYFGLFSLPFVREPRENRGRLRHCNGLQASNATESLDERIGKAEVREYPKSGYRFGCARRGQTHLPDAVGRLLR